MGVTSPREAEEWSFIRNRASVPSSTSTGSPAQMVESHQWSSGSYPCAHGLLDAEPVKASANTAVAPTAIRMLGSRVPPCALCEGAAGFGAEALGFEVLAMSFLTGASVAPTAFG